MNIAKEIDQLIDQMVNLANTRVNDKYLFNGTDTTGHVDPLTGERNTFIRQDDGTFVVSNNTNDVLIEVSAGAIQRNSDPSSVFSEDLFNDSSTCQ